MISFLFWETSVLSFYRLYSLILFILSNNPFRRFIVLIVYLFIIYLIYWKSIIYRETIDCLFCFSCLQPFCENTWMMAFANFDLAAICENDLKPKNFFWPWTWLCILYIRGTPAPRQGPNSHQHVLTIGLRASEPAR